MTKRTFIGVHATDIFFFFASPLIFVPQLEVLFFINHYFLVCVFKYCTSTRIFSSEKHFNLGLDI